MTAESLGLTGQKCLTSLAVILTEASARKATDWASSLLYCVLEVWANPYSSCMIFWPMDWDLPYPIRTVYCISICIFTDQSEWLPNNQSACMILTNQENAKWTNHTVQTWSLHLHKNRPIRDQGGNFLYKKESALCLHGSTFSFLRRLHFSGLQTVYLNKVSPSITPQPGHSCCP